MKRTIPELRDDLLLIAKRIEKAHPKEAERLRQIEAEMYRSRAKQNAEMSKHLWYSILELLERYPSAPVETIAEMAHTKPANVVKVARGKKKIRDKYRVA